jgi:dCTP deaminase
MNATSVLSDGTIRALVEAGHIRIEPWDPGMVQPASVDLRLGNSFRVFHNHRITAVDLGDPPSELTEPVIVEDDGTFVIHPGEFCLGRTEEWVELVVHATAGFCDPGWRGTLTLELANFNSVPIILRPGLPIAQLSFMALDRPAERPYGHPELGSHYAGQVEATESRYQGGAGAGHVPAAANGSSVG